MSKRRKLPLRDRRPGFDLAPPGALVMGDDMRRLVERIEAWLDEIARTHAHSVGRWHASECQEVSDLGGRCNCGVPELGHADVEAKRAIVAAWRATFDNLPAEGVTQFRAGRRIGLEIALRAMAESLPPDPDEPVVIA